MKYIALLRGVNVGGRIVKSADLADCFKRLGLKDVRTVLQSGNVVFEAGEPDTAQLKLKIEQELSVTFNYPAKAQVISVESLRKIIADYPFGVASPDQHDYVIFMEDGLEKALAAEPCELAPDERTQAGSSVVYWRVAKGQTLTTDFAKLLTKAKYKNFNTTRNLKTLQKLL